jgi:hypothetical protein
MPAPARPRKHDQNNRTTRANAAPAYGPRSVNRVETSTERQIWAAVARACYLCCLRGGHRCMTCGMEDEDVWSWQLWVSWHSRGNLLLDQLIRKVEDKEVEFVTLVMLNARSRCISTTEASTYFYRRLTNVTNGATGTHDGHHRAPTGCSTELRISRSLPMKCAIVNQGRALEERSPE